MKKVLLFYALMLVTISGYAQGAQELIDNYRDNSDVTVMDITKEMIGMVASQAPSEAAKSAMDVADGMVIAIISRDETANEISGKLDILSDNGYEEESIDKDGIKAKILVKKEGDTYTEIVMFVTAQETNMLTLIKGKFTEEQINALRNDN